MDHVIALAHDDFLRCENPGAPGLGSLGYLIVEIDCIQPPNVAEFLQEVTLPDVEMLGIPLIRTQDALRNDERR